MILTVVFHMQLLEIIMTLVIRFILYVHLTNHRMKEYFFVNVYTHKNGSTKRNVQKNIA